MKVIYRSIRAQDIHDRSLVLHAMGIEHELSRGIVGWRIYVAEHEEALAHEQWRLYELENVPRSKPKPWFSGTNDAIGARVGTMGWVAVLVTVYIFQINHEFGVDWLGAGRVQVGAIRAGEWWRAITALTLHADVAHLSGNLIFGSLFGYLLAREIGGGLAWILILVGGMSGNLMNAAVQLPSHRSIGASTAVFAALGLLSAYLWTGRRLLHEGWARRWAPVVGGILLLTWIGTGDEGTDIVAHLTGFVAGFGIGAFLGRTLQPGGPGLVPQIWLGGLSLLMVTVAWRLAF